MRVFQLAPLWCTFTFHAPLWCTSTFHSLVRQLRQDYAFCLAECRHTHPSLVRSLAALMQTTCTTHSTRFVGLLIQNVGCNTHQICLNFFRWIRMP